MNAVKIASRRKRVVVLRRALAGFEARAVASIGRGELLKRLDTIQHEAGDVSRVARKAGCDIFWVGAASARSSRHRTGPRASWRT